MPYITWTEKFNTNIDIIDEQHKGLVSIINELHNLMLLGMSREFIGSILQQLVNYAAEHFSAEEKILQENNFPDLNEHRKEHDKFVEKIIGFRDSFNEGKMLISMDILNYLKSWLLEHILVSDRKFISHIGESKTD